MGIEVRLARHLVDLPSGGRAGVSVAGWGVPLVLVNGYSTEGILYAQTTSRLVSMGFKVVAIDTPGHGRSSRLKTPREGIQQAARFIAEAMEALGIGPCVLAGHSTGGRVAAEVTLAKPDDVALLMLIDAIASATWDRQVAKMRKPGYGALLGLRTTADFLGTALRHVDRDQAAKMLRMNLRSSLERAGRPGTLAAPGMAILNASPSAATLEKVREQGTPSVVLHGDADGLVPFAVGADAARALHAPLVVIEDGGHLWLLQDPETLPRIVGELLHGVLGDAYTGVVRRIGLDPATATTEQIEQAAYAPGAPIFAITPEVGFQRGRKDQQPTHRWHVVEPS